MVQLVVTGPVVVVVVLEEAQMLLLPAMREVLRLYTGLLVAVVGLVLEQEPAEPVAGAEAEPSVSLWIALAFR